MSNSLWGDEFIIETPAKTKEKKILDKVKSPKKEVKVTTEKIIKSKKVSIEEKLELIRSEVTRILGVYAENTQVINTRDELHNYISMAIANNVIAIDTETNNSLDPITCKIMGGCIYTPGGKNIYIPINHINRETGELLTNQLTENDLKEEFQRLIDNNTKIIMHNGKFDYQVIKCTCDICLPIYWDTLVGAKVLNENERAGLKQQYIEKIDNSIEKYSIEHLFDIDYAIVEPELFALYAATDAFMTYKLYIYQLDEFNKAENISLTKLFYEVEMPLVPVLAELELNGMEVDQEYAERLSKKYHTKLIDIDEKINKELIKLQPKIDAWRLTPDATFHPLNKAGTGEGKSKSEQLTDPINLASPTQLAILFYDVLDCPAVNKKKPRSTREEDLKALAEKYELPICKLLLDRRACVKLTTTYIDNIPELAKRWPDGRVRTHFNQFGADTGRLSSSDPLNF